MVWWAPGQIQETTDESDEIDESDRERWGAQEGNKVKREPELGEGKHYSRESGSCVLYARKEVILVNNQFIGVLYLYLLRMKLHSRITNGSPSCQVRNGQWENQVWSQLRLPLNHSQAVSLSF